MTEKTPEKKNSTESAKSEMKCQGNDILIYACSGASNTGQIANQVAKDLTISGIGKMACLTVIGIGSPSHIKNAKEAKIRVVIDGCQTICAKKMLEREGIKPDLSFVIADMGVKKSPGPVFEANDVKTASEKITAKIKEYVKEKCK